MNRGHRPLLVASLAMSAAGLAASAVAVAHAARPPARAAALVTVRVKQTDLGKILVSGSGSTLFIFTRDRRNADRCVRVNGCRSVWPVLKAKGRPTAGRGLVRARISTIKLSNGTRQVTYAGHPLYTYSYASGPGDTSYVGARQFGGSWYALNPAGRAVR